MIMFFKNQIEKLSIRFPTIIFLIIFLTVKVSFLLRERTEPTRKVPYFI